MLPFIHSTNAEPTDFSIRAGSTLRSEGGQLITVEDLVIHPNYDDWTLEWDIAVLKLEENLILGESVALISLPNRYLKVSHDTIASIAGWGSLYVNMKLS